MNLKPVILLFLLPAGQLSCRGDMDLPLSVKGGLFQQAWSGPSRGRAHLLYEETFEGPRPFSTAHLVETGAWPYALQFVQQPVFQGKKAARFEIRKEQPLVKNGKRSEVCIVKGRDGGIGREAWYSFMVYCPSAGYEFDRDREVISQWYQKGSPAMSLRTHRDAFLLEAGNRSDNRQRYDLGRIAKDEWTEFVLHVVHSSREDGLVEVWRDQKKILTVAGGNMYDSFLPKWKIGLYKAGFKNNTSQVSKRVIYFDNIRVGSAQARLRDMSSL